MARIYDVKIHEKAEWILPKIYSRRIYDDYNSYIDQLHFFPHLGLTVESQNALYRANTVGPFVLIHKVNEENKKVVVIGAF
jgi:mRNA-degrading endonuclease RelE of RelBE toxin-antitoxin system